MNNIIKTLLFLAELDGFGKVAIWIAIGCFFLPIFILTMIVCVKTILRKRKEIYGRKKDVKVSEETRDYYAIFGGNDNIESIKKEMTRVSITVKNMKQVNLDELRELKIGILISGNTIKCSSAMLVEYFEEK